MTQNKRENKSQITYDKNIIWENETIPRSIQFDDTYYSKADGYAETQYVFIKGNALPERWQTMSTCTIGELGFGTGLNFLVTAIEWEKTIRPADQKLNFISFEQYPLTHTDMNKALSRWPSLNDEADKLVDFWQSAMSTLDKNNKKPIVIKYSPNITLTVYIGDANEQLSCLNSKIDAWYLDGFSPAKNPELWNETLMQNIANNTIKNGTFATYTAASFVRKYLSNAGFKVERLKGHAGKRHMSVGTLLIK